MSAQHRRLPRPSWIGDQGRAWLRDLGNAAIVATAISAMWWLIFHAPKITVAIVAGDRVIPLN